MMYIDKQVANTIKTYGRQFRMNGLDFKALLQPLRYKNKMYLSGIPTSIGRAEEGYYLYVGPPDIEIDDSSTDELVCEGMSYCIEKSESVYFGTRKIYTWAVLKRVRQ